MSKLVGYADRSWTDRKTGEVKERVVIWLEKEVEGLCGNAYEEVICEDSSIFRLTSSAFYFC